MIDKDLLTASRATRLRRKPRGRDFTEDWATVKGLPAKAYWLAWHSFTIRCFALCYGNVLDISKKTVKVQFEGILHSDGSLPLLPEVGQQFTLAAGDVFFRRRDVERAFQLYRAEEHQRLEGRILDLERQLEGIEEQIRLHTVLRDANDDTVLPAKVLAKIPV